MSTFSSLSDPLLRKLAKRLKDGDLRRFTMINRVCRIAGELEQERRNLKSLKFDSVLPKLTGGPWRLIGFQTGDYNCFCHAIGIKDLMAICGEPNSFSTADFFYGQFGFSRIYPDPNQRLTQSPPFLTDDNPLVGFEPTLVKAVVYGGWQNSRGSDCTVSHHALRVANGWESKLGSGELIWHKRLDQLTWSKYGKPILLYSKPRQ